MRPLYHPHPDEMTIPGILHALSDPVRVRILNGLRDPDCSRNCATFTNVGETPLAKSTLSQHFRILREAGLILSERKGVELRNRMRCEDLEPRFGPMIRAILDAYHADCVAKSGAAGGALAGSRG